MKTQFVLGFVLFLGACTPSIPMDDSLLMGDKLFNTEWQSKDARNKKKIYFMPNDIKFDVGSLLGTTNMSYSMVDQDQNYVLYRIDDEYSPSLVGVVQVDEKTIKTLVLQNNVMTSNSTPASLKKEIMDMIDTKGGLFTITKKIKQK